MPEDASIQKSLSELAGDVKALAGSVNALVSNQQLHQDQLVRQDRDIASISRDLSGLSSSSGKIPTTVIVSIIAAVLGIVGFATSVGSSFLRQEIYRAETIQTLSTKHITAQMAEDDAQEVRDHERFDALERSISVEELANANHEGRIGENEIELGYFFDWYHPFLEKWGGLIKTVELLELQAGKNTQAHEHLTESQATVESKIIALEQRLNAVQGTIGNIENTVRISTIR